jgi:hypothetical protein
MNVLEVLNLPARTILNLADSNQGSVQVIVQPAGGGAAGVALSNVKFVDQATTSTSPDGSAANPFPTCTAAYAALALLSVPGVIVLTPYDYSAEASIDISTNVTFLGYGNGDSAEVPSTPTGSAKLPPLNCVQGGLEVTFQNVRPSAFTDTGGSSLVTVDGCNVAGWSAGNFGTIRFANSTFQGAANLSDFARVNFDVPSFLSWQLAGGTVSGGSPTPRVEGPAALSIPFYAGDAAANGQFLNPYGCFAAASVEGALSAYAAQGARFVRLRLQSTVPIAAAALTLTLRVNGVNTALAVTVNPAGTSGQATLALTIAATARLSLIATTAGATFFTGAVWGTVDLYP